jgi:hypothetical protein
MKANCPRPEAGSVFGAARSDNRGPWQLASQQGQQCPTARLVEGTCRVVHEYPIGTLDQKSRKGETLLLIEREFRVPSTHPVKIRNEVLEIELLQGLHDSSVGRGRGR